MKELKTHDHDSRVPMSTQVRDLEDSNLVAVSSSSSSGPSDVSKQLLNLLLRREFRDLLGRMKVVKRRSGVVDGVIMEGESRSKDGLEKRSSDTTCSERRKDRFSSKKRGEARGRGTRDGHFLSRVL